MAGTTRSPGPPGTVRTGAALGDAPGVVFIAGLGHSGTTLLQSMRARGPRLAARCRPGTLALNECPVHPPLLVDRT